MSYVHDEGGFLAESCVPFVQALDFDKAEALCEHALSIHKEHGEESSLEEAADRRLLALVLSAKGNNEKSLENLTIALSILQEHNLEVYYYTIKM